MNRRELRVNEEIVRVLAMHFPNYEATSGNLRAISRRVSNDLFDQGRYYEAVRDAVLGAQAAGELVSKEPPQPRTAPRPTPVPRQPEASRKFVDVEKQVAFVEAVLKSEFPKWAKVDSNVAMILPALEGQPFCIESVRLAIAKCGPKLAVSTDYKEALESFFEKHPEFKTQANETLLVQAAMTHFGTVTAQSLEDCLVDATIDLKLSMTPAARKLHEDETERQQIIQQLLSAKTAIRADGVKIITNETNQTETFDHFKLRIEQMGLPELRQIRDARSAARSYRSMSKEQLREVVRWEHAASHPAPSEFLPLPAEFVVPGKPSITMKWSRKLILSLPAPLLADITRKYGSEAINKILNQG